MTIRIIYDPLEGTSVKDANIDNTVETWLQKEGEVFTTSSLLSVLALGTRLEKESLLDKVELYFQSVKTGELIRINYTSDMDSLPKEFEEYLEKLLILF